MINRRQLLKYLAALPAVTTAGRLFAAPATDSKLLLVFLRGGYDAASLLVPISSPFYYQERPNIAVPRPSAEVSSSIALDSNWGLHPALRDNVYRLYQNGQAAFIPFAGSEDLSRSHFETQDSIELGQALSGRRNYQSGFLNRLASVLNGSKPMAFTEQLPLIFRGDVQVPNSAVKSIGQSGLDARQSQIIASMYRGTRLDTIVSEGFEVRKEVMRELAVEMDAANRNALSTKGFSAEARSIAKLMRDKYSIGFIDVGGWDTHVGQGGATGYLAGRLDELGRGLAGFADEMGSTWASTVVVVISEFGRTLRENGNRGTDHGHGSVYWVLGGSVHGGRVAGEQVPVEQRFLFQDRDYPVLNEYRALLAGLFTRMYGLSARQTNKIFASIQPMDLGLL
jgi:uncharacterized protein (DUF1501 family)